MLKRYWITATLGMLFLSACGMARSSLVYAPAAKKTLDGPANAANGERIYFTATSARGTQITYRAPKVGNMMMSYLSCAACHGPSAGGGMHNMHMQVMHAPSITYAALSEEHAEEGNAETESHDDEHGEYSLEQFRLAVLEGKHADGSALDANMPRWNMSEDDLNDLLEFLKSLSEK